MAITFPSSPSAGDIFTSNGKSWQYVNGKWEAYGEIIAPDVFSVDEVNDVVNVYGSLSAGASASIAGDLVVDINTLVVDSTNNRVGIGTTTPTVPLDVVGDTFVASASGDDYLNVDVEADDTHFRTRLSRSLSMDGQSVDLSAYDSSTYTALPLSIDGDPVSINNLRGVGAVDFTLADSVTLDGSITDYGTSVALNSGDNQLVTQLVTDGSTWGEVRAWDTNTEANIELYLSGSTVYVGNDMDAGSGTMFVDSANNRVGIGTTSPDQKVHIVQDGGNLSSGNVGYETKGTIHLQNSGGTKGDGELSTGVSFSGTNTGRRRGLIAAYQDGTDGDPHGLQFFTYGSTSSASDAVTSRMTIDSSGNVGIGTTTPVGRLTVYSNASTGNGVEENYFVMDRPSTSYESSINWATAGVKKWFLGTDNTGNDDLLLYDWAGGNISMYGDSGTGIITLPQQPAFTARITTTGVRYDGQLLPFSSASLNLGNHYSTSTYLFTAPISGHYFFSYSVLIRNNSGTARTETGFWKNGGWLMNRGNSYVNSTGSVSDHNQASSSVITYMSANDTMGIYQLQASPSDTYGGTALSIFTGRLVS